MASRNAKLTANASGLLRRSVTCSQCLVGTSTGILRSPIALDRSDVPSAERSRVGICLSCQFNWAIQLRPDNYTRHRQLQWQSPIFFRDKRRISTENDSNPTFQQCQ